jgi:hypothetical protein
VEPLESAGLAGPGVEPSYQLPKVKLQFCHRTCPRRVSAGPPDRKGPHRTPKPACQGSVSVWHH